MIGLDPTVFIQIVLFLFLWFVLNRLLFKPFLKLLEERERKTEGLKSEASALAAEAEKLKREYEIQVARAREEAAAVKESIVNEARQTKERILSQVREETAERLAKVREEVRRALAREREAALREAEEIGRRMAEKILGRSIG
jgi:F-type H+-transporting ATPase subunit b